MDTAFIISEGGGVKSMSFLLLAGFRPPGDTGIVRRVYGVVFESGPFCAPVCRRHTHVRARGWVLGTSIS